MHSFHPSRSKMVFEIFCALAMGASFGLAWIQTGASAFLAMAAVAGLFSLVHAASVPGRRRAMPVAAVQAGGVPEEQADLLDMIESAPPVTVADVDIAPPAPDEELVADAAPVEEVAPVAIAEEPQRTKAKRPAKRKSSKASPPEAVVEESAQPIDIAHFDDEDRPPIAPLFEPDPFVRQHRAVFGRRRAAT